MDTLTRLKLLVYPKAFYTLSEAATILDCSRNTLTRMIEKGQLARAHKKPGSKQKIRIPFAALQAAGYTPIPLTEELAATIKHLEESEQEC